MSEKKIHTLCYGGSNWIDVDGLFDFAKDEKNNRIVIKGREFIAPVRCKDCKRWDKNQKFCTRYKWVMDEDMFADDFCSRGVKKGEID